MRGSQERVLEGQRQGGLVQVDLCDHLQKGIQVYPAAVREQQHHRQELHQIAEDKGRTQEVELHQLYPASHQLTPPDVQDLLQRDHLDPHLHPGLYPGSYTDTGQGEPTRVDEEHLLRGSLPDGGAVQQGGEP